MANSSTTLFMLLLLIVASGSMVLARRDAVLAGPCLTNLGACGSKTCDQDCCAGKCFSNFNGKHPNPVCELLPGSSERLCNCYHDC
ncbi:unnamed protein product [Withania somnifera]